MCFIIIHAENYLFYEVLESLKRKCMTDIDQSVKNRWLITAQVIKIKTMILCICITLLIVTFSVIIVSNLTDIGSYSFHSLINSDMHDRFWWVSNTMGMSISQKSLN